MRTRTWIVTASAGLVLADASIVTLALPELLQALETSVEGVAAVIAVYTAVLALALLPAQTARRRWGALVRARPASRCSRWHRPPARSPTRSRRCSWLAVCRRPAGRSASSRRSS